MDSEDFARRLANCEAYNAALLTVVQTLINLQPDQALARACVEDSMERLMASGIARSTSDPGLEALLWLRTQLPPMPSGV